MKYLIKMILKLGKFKWIVTDDDSIGFRLFGINFVYYKWHDGALIYTPFDRDTLGWRIAEKRELSKNIKFVG